MKKQLLLIDVQNDFVNPNGSLFVPGADEDAKRTAQFIVENIEEIDHIALTIDDHNTSHVSLDTAWKNVDPFTSISLEDYLKGKYTIRDDARKGKILQYLETLKLNKKPNLTVWPAHCLVGSWGQCIDRNVFNAVLEWEKHNNLKAKFFRKGQDDNTDQYSLFSSESSTGIDTKLAFKFYNMKNLFIAGQEKYICVGSSIIDIVKCMGDGSNITLLNNCTSSIGATDDIYRERVKNLENAIKEFGISVKTTKEIK